MKENKLQYLPKPQDTIHISNNTFYNPNEADKMLLTVRDLETKRGEASSRPLFIKCEEQWEVLAPSLLVSLSRATDMKGEQIYSFQQPPPPHLQHSAANYLARGFPTQPKQ